jgi:hypothetical protein
MYLIIIFSVIFLIICYFLITDSILRSCSDEIPGGIFGTLIGCGIAFILTSAIVGACINDSSTLEYKDQYLEIFLLIILFMVNFHKD